MQELLEFLAAHGFPTDYPYTLDGYWHRPLGSGNGAWFRGSALVSGGKDIIIASIGDWSSKLVEGTLHFRSTGDFTKKEEKNFEKEFEKQREEERIHRQNIQREAAKKAQEFWESLGRNENNDSEHGAVLVPEYPGDGAAGMREGEGALEPSGHAADPVEGLRGNSEGLPSARNVAAYLLRKGFNESFGTRIYRGAHGPECVVPLLDENGFLWGVQRISGDGKFKSFSFYDGDKLVSGMRLAGSFYPLLGESRDTIIVAEGLATAASIFLAFERRATVCAAFTAGNLRAAAAGIRSKYPNARIVFAADNDCWKDPLKNPGLEAARAASRAIPNSCVVIPAFSLDGSYGGTPTDFNDLHLLAGLGAVRSQIQSQLEQSLVTFDPVQAYLAPFPDEVPSGKGFRRLGTPDNVAELLRRIKVSVRYNIISKEEETVVPGASYSVDNRQNAALAHIYGWCARAQIPTDNLAGYLTKLADENPHNPVAAWVESKPWDGESRLAAFCRTLQVEPGLEALRDILVTKWLVSAIAAAYAPGGVSAHGVLVLQGRQYLGKTKWFKMLCPPVLQADGVLLRPDDKDSVFLVLSKWLIELGELDATFKKADIAQLKSFITKDKDTLRRPYAKKESNYARRTVFFASVNEPDFLKDPTGNRRFWTIKCEKIDYEHKIDMQQLWLEVLGLYKAGHAFRLTGEELDLLNASNDHFQEIDPIEEKLRASFKWSDMSKTEKMTAVQICEKLDITRPNSAECRSIARAMRRICGQSPRKSDGLKVYDIPQQISCAPYNGF